MENNNTGLMFGMLGCFDWQVFSDVLEETNASIFSVNQYNPWTV
jgi:hypothetical protein